MKTSIDKHAVWFVIRVRITEDLSELGQFVNGLRKIEEVSISLRAV